MTTEVGGAILPVPVMTAAGTSGYGAELGAYVDLSQLGAVVVKSLSAQPWAGNAAPRIHGTAAGMVNSVGLDNPGVESWLADHLPHLDRAGARTVVSIWGRSVGEYARAMAALIGGLEKRGGAPPDSTVAVEVNVSCPNLEERRGIFAHDPDMTARVIAACVAEAGGRKLPIWAKLSPNVTDLVPVVSAAMGAGAAAVTLGNTLMGLVIDVESRRPLLGGGGGGLSGSAIRPVAVRNVFEVHAAMPEVPIVGVGGITTGRDAVEFLMAGAVAVQVGTATFADPRASTIVSDELTTWCETHGVGRVSEIIGAAHEH